MVTSRRTLSFLVLILMSLSGKAQQWIEDSFKDFIDGTLDASGNNIYVSYDGKVQTIHRFDLNTDGFIDLLFCQTHNSINSVPATLAEISSTRKIISSELTAEGSLQSAAADLNKDGYTDLVFCPNYKGIQSNRGFITLIYGGDDGWPASRRTSALPVNEMKGVVVTDMNTDGWPDIVSLNGKAWLPGQPSGNILRIFWGSARGFLNTRFLDVGAGDAIAMASADINNKDSFSELYILNKDAVKIFYADKAQELDKRSTVIALPSLYTYKSIATGDYQGDRLQDLFIGTEDSMLVIVSGDKDINWKPAVHIPAFNATNIVVGDIDKDNYTDVVLTYFSQRRAAFGEFGGSGTGSGEAAHILWGSEKGLSKEMTTSLPAKNLSASDIGDFDGDGNNDVVIAINRGETDFTTQSIIYFGKEKRSFVSLDSITTTGAFHVLSVQQKGQLHKAIFSNSMGGTIGERVPIYIYWGAQGGFTAKNRTEIPFRSGYEGTAADFNADGQVDLAVMDEMHGGQKLDEDPWAGANIFWGETNKQLDSNSKRTVLSESQLGSSNTADLNKDGFLDLVLGQYDDFDPMQTFIIIYYGTPNGFIREKRTTIPCSGRSLSIQLADYNKDGWLDIAANSYRQVGIRIFYGSADGFDENRKSELDAPAVCDNETADLNGDGWLDIIATSYSDVANNEHHDMGMFIFWGSEKGFDHANSQWLPGFVPLGPVVADFDNDNYLDIFAPSYHSDLTRESQPCYLYWGSAKGFSNLNRTILINDSGADGLAADFDKDGKLDLAVANHSVDGNHNCDSRIFYNDGNRFSSPKIEKVPTLGPHWMYNEDMGHIYNRSWQQEYTSSIFSWKKNRISGNINCKADVPALSGMAIQVRAASTKDAMLQAAWKSVEGEGNFIVNPSDRFLQYKIIFQSKNGDQFPALDKVTINLYP